MTDLNNGYQNQDGNSNNNNQSQNNKAPGYSFWAEQVPRNPYSYNNNQQNNNNNTWNGNQMPGMNPGSDRNQAPNMNQMPNMNQAQGMNQMPNMNQAPNMNQMPNMNQAQGMNQMPNMNQAPNMNHMSNMNQAPNMNQMPGMDPRNWQQNKKKKSGTGNKVFKFIGKAVCFGLIAVVSFIGIGKLVDTVYPEATTVGILAALDSAGSDSNYKISNAETATVKKVSKSATTAVANETLPAIVSIDCTSKQTAQDWFGQQYSQDVQSSGSGIIVGKTDKELLIATNNHVVEGANDITITFKDGSKVKNAKTKGADSTADLAVVSVDITKISSSTLKAISVAKLGDSSKVKVGEMAVAIGNALGYGPSVTVGYISAKDREVEVSDSSSTSTSSKKMKFLQTDAAINPGNSGGALLNMNGEVIGINTVKYASDEVEGMGYAIPISTATPIIKELMSREILNDNEKGFLGITGFDVTDEAASYYNIPVGVYVKEILSGGSADKAGLKAEDVITAVDKTSVSSITQLREYVNSKRVGTKIKVTYMRNTDGKYKKATVVVTLQKNPNLDSSDTSK